jgi:uncharacterized protein
MLEKRRGSVHDAAGATAGCARRQFHPPCGMLTNVLGGPLRPCCMDPATGYFRDGYCRTGSSDLGLHTVCARLTREFLEFSRSRGNDLSTPVPEFGFLGLAEGDRWCLCVQRWAEALRAGCAPPVILEACHVSALEFVDLEDLKAHAAPAASEPE